MEWLTIASHIFVWLTGNVHANGGSATSSGGGGGGYIAIYYSAGFVDTRDLTCYGGTTNNGETGAAGVIYLENNGDRKVHVNCSLCN